eukprot:CAMPEP_0119301638 /NCGR_PEP_ID=MMETSP1333-20130426/3378_1 /TAXON_ID=418940 /ORGANISM="Scyphosphaera apsteinii, Strain RCC1455" /LENGTH=323 /DNA_ID=CAMNT_0007303761 /DNA_START=416 /DNA_END=1388 /DNA_ORIENTATION=-
MLSGAQAVSATGMLLSWMKVPLRQQGLLNAVLLCSLLGWMNPSDVDGDSGIHLQTMLGLLSLRTEELHLALRQWMAPANPVVPLPFSDWLKLKTLFVAKRFVEDPCVKHADLHQLADATKVWPWCHWLDAFGLPQMQARSYQSPDMRLPIVRQRAEISGACALSVEDLLVLTAPANVQDGWETPLAWFVQNSSHMAEVFTEEGVTALAMYLARRQQELANGREQRRPIVEVAAAAAALHTFLTRNSQGACMRVLPTDEDPRPDLLLGDHAYMLSAGVEKLDHTWERSVNIRRTLCCARTCHLDRTGVATGATLACASTCSSAN